MKSNKWQVQLTVWIVINLFLPLIQSQNSNEDSSTNFNGFDNYSSSDDYSGYDGNSGYDDYGYYNGNCNAPNSISLKKSEINFFR